MASIDISGSANTVGTVSGEEVADEDGEDDDESNVVDSSSGGGGDKLVSSVITPTVIFVTVPSCRTRLEEAGAADDETAALDRLRDDWRIVADAWERNGSAIVE